MTGLELYEKVRTVPENAQREIKGGRLSGKTDINPMWRLKTLTEQFGPCGIGWYYVPIKKWTEQSGDEIAAFVDIELYIKVDDEWSKPITGTGGSMFVAKESKGLYVSDECYKMATTDAISVACKQLGIGADIYWEADKTKYDKPEAQPKKPLATKEQINKLNKECQRTGLTEKVICSQYKLNTFSEMEQWQSDDAMKRFANTPDKANKNKAPDPATIPPDNINDELPWSTPQR